MKKYVYFFGGGKADGDAKMKELLGGKGANLAEMSNLGIPVPPGFTITTEVCTHYMKSKGEYGEAVAMCALIATVFLGGWQGPILPPWLWLIIKIVAVFFVMIWTRSTLPRVRIDQLMALAWKFLFPLALVNLLVMALETLAWPEALPLYIIPVNFAITGALILLGSRLYKVGWGRVEV